jgi:hypothetical protein
MKSKSLLGLTLGLVALAVVSMPVFSQGRPAGVPGVSGQNQVLPITTQSMMTAEDREALRQQRLQEIEERQAMIETKRAEQAELAGQQAAERGQLAQEEAMERRLAVMQERLEQFADRLTIVIGRYYERLSALIVRVQSRMNIMNEEGVDTAEA